MGRVMRLAALLARAGVAPGVRGEALDIAAFAAIANALALK
jgi:hypothetical protein